jgi:hypothetical protein
MKFRYARHTNNIDRLSDFYTAVIGLDIIGRFEKHDNYRGVMLGHSHCNWHLEFTESDKKAKHQADEDDLMVFYVNSNEELNAIKRDALIFGYRIFNSRNPYWTKHGIELRDPDDYGIILSLDPLLLNATDNTTQLIRSEGIDSWHELLEYIKNLPYGRNTDRTNLDLVLTERKGTCSSKHAFLKQVADLNHIPGIKLLMGIYKMNESNTHGIGNVLSNNQLDYIPEAHCYLSLNGKRIDLTHSTSDIQSLRKDIMEEMEIKPIQVGTFKIEYHQNFLRKWIEKINLQMSFSDLWSIREQCIQALSRNNHK